MILICKFEQLLFLDFLINSNIEIVTRPAAIGRRRQVQKMLKLKVDKCRLIRAK